MNVIVCTWWRLLCVPDEGYCVYLIKVIMCTWWRLFKKRAMHTKLDTYVFINFCRIMHLYNTKKTQKCTIVY